MSDTNPLRLRRVHKDYFSTNFSTVVLYVKYTSTVRTNSRALLTKNGSGEFAKTCLGCEGQNRRNSNNYFQIILAPQDTNILLFHAIGSIVNCYYRLFYLFTRTVTRPSGDKQLKKAQFDIDIDIDIDNNNILLKTTKRDDY